MKRVYFLFIVLATTLYACVDNELVNINGELRVTAEFVNTRVVHKEAEGVYNALWESGDKIGLFAESQNNLQYSALSAGKATDFVHVSSSEKLNVKDGTKVYAYYPYTTELKEKLVKLPSTDWQLYSDSINYDFLYATGTVEGNVVSLQFKHLYAYLKLTIQTDLLEDANEVLEITSSEAIAGNNETGYFDPVNEKLITGNDTVDNEESGHTFSYKIPKSVLSGKKEITCYMTIYPQSENTTLLIKKLTNRGYMNTILSKKAPEGGFKAGYVYSLGITEEAHTVEREREALIELYNSTNGDNWYNNTNWCSDKPLSEWYGISVTNEGRVRGLALYDNNLIGTVPESFSIFFDDCAWLYVGGNTLSGIIPETIRTHPRWNEFGYDFIRQYKIYTDYEPVGFDMNNINLKITNRDLFLIDNSKVNSMDWCKEHKLNLVLTASKNILMIPELTKRFINLQLDFQNKGLNTMLYYTDCSLTDELKQDDWGKLINNGLTKNLCFSLKSEQNFLCPQNSSTVDRQAYIFGAEGNLLNYVNYDNYVRPGMADSESFFKKVQSVIAQYLGEPEEHPEYTEDLYTSTDYSKDGEVTILQKATVGTGINLVFMGDAFVDLDMNEGGTYEQTMRQGMEKLFGIKPYTQYRDRFNVYMVKAVSPNASYDENAIRAINSDEDCFKYALKIPGMKENNLGIIMIGNPEKVAQTSYNVSYTDGSHISFILSDFSGGETIAHEFSHGFAKLADEYVTQGLENVSVTENDKIALDDSWNNFGWGANIDWRNDPQTVRWAHLLKDDRFSGEGLGIYEGANNFGKGCYRPTQNSVMNDHYNAPYFNAPCREQIYKSVMELSEGSDWNYDYETFVNLDIVTRGVLNSKSISIDKYDGKETMRNNHKAPIRVNGTWRDSPLKGTVIVPLR